MYAGGAPVGGFSQTGMPLGVKRIVPSSPGIFNCAPHGTISFKITRRPPKSQPGLLRSVEPPPEALTPNPTSIRPSWLPVERTGTAEPLNVVVVSPVHCEFEALRAEKPAGGVMVVVMGIVKTDVWLELSICVYSRFWGVVEEVEKDEL